MDFYLKSLLFAAICDKSPGSERSPLGVLLPNVVSVLYIGVISVAVIVIAAAIIVAVIVIIIIIIIIIVIIITAVIIVIIVIVIISVIIVAVTVIAVVVLRGRNRRQRSGGRRCRRGLVARHFVFVAGGNIQRARNHAVSVGVELFVDYGDSGLDLVIDILGQADDYLYAVVKIEADLG